MSGHIEAIGEVVEMIDAARKEGYWAGWEAGRASGYLSALDEALEIIRNGATIRGVQVALLKIQAERSE